MVIVFHPTFNAIGSDAEPLVTVTSFTVTVALAWLAVGVIVTSEVLCPTLVVYEVVPDENVGASVPELMTRLERVASVEPSLVTVIVYVPVVVPSWAVTIVVIVLAPTFRVIGSEATPVATAVPFTVTVALAWLTVGVTVKLVTSFITSTVYVVVLEENSGLRVPWEIVRSESVVSVLAIVKETSGAFDVKFGMNESLSYPATVK